MKTINFFLLLTFSICYLQSNAQITVGLQGGISKAWEEYGDVGLPDDAEIEITGFNISGLVYYKMNTYLSIGVEPGVSQRGAACVPGWNGGRLPFFRGDTKLYLRYIEMPLMVSGRLPIWKNKLSVFGKLGYGASLLGAAYEETTDLSTDNPTVIRNRIDLNEDGRLNRIDHGFYGAAGLSFQIRQQEFFASINHYRGLRDADKNNKSLNRDLGIRLGWMTNL